jgi:hypothetical protein
MIFKTLFLSSITLIFAQQAAAETPLTGAYAVKDITISGLLLAAVIFLYRELGRERKKSEEVTGATKVFIHEQTVLMQAAAKEQSGALSKVGDALDALKASSDAQIEIHRTHVKAIIDSALASKKGQ